MGGLATKMRMAPKRSAMSATRIGVSAKQAKFHQQTCEFGHGKQAEFLNDKSLTKWHVPSVTRAPPLDSHRGSL